MDDRVMKPITEFCSINMGQSPDSKTYNEKGEGIPFYQGNADFGEIHPKTRVWCSKPVKIADKDDILISVRAPIGAMNIATEKCCIGRGLASITPNDDRCNSQYLFYALKSKTESLMMQGTGSTFKAISRKVLENTQIPEYSEEEQKFIVEAMSSVEKALRIKKEELDNLENLVESRFVEMFGDPEINVQGWKEESLSKHLAIVGGYAFKSDSFKEKGIPVLRIGNINSGHFTATNMVFWNDDESLERYAIYPGDMVMSLTGTVGKDDYGNLCILGNDYGKYYLNQRNAKLELDEEIDKYYFAQLLKFTSIKRRLTGISRGVRQANISNKDVLNLVIPVPPIELQQQFADFVEQVEKAKQVIKEQLEELETLKKSLMQKYFG